MFDVVKVKDECVAWIRDFFEKSGKLFYLHLGAAFHIPSGPVLAPLTPQVTSLEEYYGSHPGAVHEASVEFDGIDEDGHAHSPSFR
jgi:hypothetical protein